MLIIRYVIPIALLLIIYPNYSHGQNKPHIGVVSIINNIVSGEKNNKEKIFTTADKIYPGQLIKTLLNSKVQILFKDQTIINIGPDTEMLIESYADTQQNTKFSISLSRGIARFQSGTLPSESYEIKSPIAVVKLKGTKVDLLVSQSGGTEVVLRNGVATVIPSPGRPQAITPTSQPNDALILQDQNTFFRLTSDGPTSTIPQPFKSGETDFYKPEIEIEPDGTIQITAANPQRLVTERALNNKQNNVQQISTINRSNDLIRNINKSSTLIKIINEQLRQCIGPKCRILLNKRSILDQVKKHLRDRTGELIEKVRISKPQRPISTTPNPQIPPTPDIRDLQAIAKLKQAIAKLAKEETQAAKKKSQTAKKGAKAARENVKDTRKTAKQAKKALKEAKGSGVEAVTKAKEALEAAKLARKEAKTVAKEAGASAKKAKTAAKVAKSAAKIAKKEAKEATKKAKAAAKSATKKAKAATKKAKAAAKAATKKAKAASKAATKKAKAARKKAQVAAKAARRAARKAAKEAREKAKKEAK